MTERIDLSGSWRVLNAYDEVVRVLGPCEHKNLAPADWRIRRSNGEELCVRETEISPQGWLGFATERLRAKRDD